MSGLPMLLPRLITSPRHTSPRCAGIRPLAAALLLMATAALPELVHAQTVSPSSATVSVGGSVTFTMTGLPAGMTNAGWEVGPISNWSSTATTCTIYQAGNSPGANQGCVFCYYTGPHYTGTLEYVWFYVTIPNVASPPTGTISATSTNIHVGQSTTIFVSSTIDTADGDSLGYQMIACSTNVPGSSGGAPFSKNYVVFEGTSPNATYIFTPTAPGTYYFYNDVETSNFSWTSLASCTITVTPTPTTFSISPTSFTYTGSAQAPTITPTPSGATYTCDLRYGVRHNHWELLLHRHSQRKLLRFEHNQLVDHTSDPNNHLADRSRDHLRHRALKHPAQRYGKRTRNLHLFARSRHHAQRWQPDAERQVAWYVGGADGDHSW